MNRLEMHNDNFQLVFRPDGKQISILPRWDEMISLWRWNPADWGKKACDRLDENVNTPCLEISQ